jgi:hypothetical protein
VTRPREPPYGIRQAADRGSGSPARAEVGFADTTSRGIEDAPAGVHRGARKRCGLAGGGPGAAASGAGGRGHPLGSADAAAGPVAAFREGVYVEGQNVTVEYRCGRVTG